MDSKDTLTLYTKYANINENNMFTKSYLEGGSLVV